MRVREILTHLYALLKAGGVVNKSDYSCNGIEETVYWVDSKNWSMKGQCTVFNTIILNKNKIALSDDTVDSVFLHEVGHKRSPLVLILTTWIVRAPLFLLGLLSIPYSLVSIGMFATTEPSLHSTMIFTLAHASVVAIFVIPFTVLSWLDEGYAEVFAIRRMETNRYKEARDFLNRNSERSLFWKILRPFMYPPKRLIYRFV